MLEHYNQTKHPICVSFSDLSFFCYHCNEYIESPALRSIYIKLVQDKFKSKISKVQKKKYMNETEEDLSEIKKKVKVVSNWIKESKLGTFVLSGAGISTSAGCSDYRGKIGCWTMRDLGISGKTGRHVNFEKLEPTIAHRGISKMMKEGIVNFVCTTNVDGLHLKSGIPVDKLSELHGSIYKESCESCGKKYVRKYDTTTDVIEGFNEKGTGNHYTGRACEECKKGFLVDSIVHFGENLPSDELEKAMKYAKKSDLSIIFGTSLLVEPSCSIPFIPKKVNNGKVVFVNLQKTKMDKKVDLKLNCKTDTFMKLLLSELNL